MHIVHRPVAKGCDAPSQTCQKVPFQPQSRPKMGFLLEGWGEVQKFHFLGSKGPLLGGPFPNLILATGLVVQVTMEVILPPRPPYVKYSVFNMETSQKIYLNSVIASQPYCNTNLYKSSVWVFFSYSNCLCLCVGRIALI